MSKEEVNRAKEELGWKYKTKDLGDANLVLGIHIDRNRDTGTISISQHAYLKQVLEHFSKIDCNPRMTPLPPSTTLTKEQVPQTTEQ